MLTLDKALENTLLLNLATLPNDGTSLDTLNNTLERIVKVSLETLES